MDLKGQLITSHITNQMETYYARVSPCAKLIAVAGPSAVDSSIFILRSPCIKKTKKKLQ